MYYLDRMERMSAANSQHVYDLVRKRRKKKTGNEAREAVRAYFEKLAGAGSHENPADDAVETHK